MERRRFGPRYRCEIDVQANGSHAQLDVYLQERRTFTIYAAWAVRFASALVYSDEVKVTDGKVEATPSTMFWSNRGGIHDWWDSVPYVKVVINGEEHSVARSLCLEINSYVREAMEWVSVLQVLAE